MLEALSRKFALLVYNNVGKDDKQQLEIMEYSIHVLLSEIIKLAGMLLIAYLFGILNYFFISFLSIACYKVFAGGVHANSHLSCFITSSIVFFIPIILSIFIPINLLISFIIFIFNVLIIYLYAPADVENNPKKNKIIRRNLKILSYLSLIIICFIALFCIKDTTLKGIMIYGPFLSSISMTPIVYKLMKVNYGYKSVK